MKQQNTFSSKKIAVIAVVLILIISGIVVYISVSKLSLNKTGADKREMIGEPPQDGNNRPEFDGQRPPFNDQMPNMETEEENAQ